MSLLRHVSRGLSVLFRRSAADADLDRELQHFLDESAAELEARGVPRDEARRRARRELGPPLAVREQVRDAAWENTVASLIFDIRFAVRMLRKTPIFTIVLVLVVSLGSGAVATIFSAMNATVLRPLPGVTGLDRLVTIRPSRPDGSGVEQGSYSYFTALRDRSSSLEGVAAWGRVTLTLSTAEGGASVFANMVSASYFPLLGVQPALGRFFGPQEDRTPGSDPVLVVSHDYWTTHLGADPSAIGRTVVVNGHPFTVIGVAPASFRGVYTGLHADAWVPLMMQPLLRPRSDLANASWLWLFGKRRPEMTIAAAEKELSAVASTRLDEIGVARDSRALSVVRLSPLSGLPGGEGRTLLAFFGVLLAAAVLVLLIAGVNVGAMLSARYVARDSEMAVRAALGAGRARLLRQLLTEVLVLFLLGAAGGFAVAHLATAALERMPLPVNVPLTLELTPDLRVLAFSIAVTLTAGLLFGLMPALRGARRDITLRLRQDSAGAGFRTPVMRLLIAGQLALSFVLLTAAGLFGRALLSGQRVDPGFTIAGIEAAWLEPESWGYDEARGRAFYEALRDRVVALPGVEAVTFTGRVPLMFSTSTDEITVAGLPPIPVNSTSVDIGYFEVLRLPVLQGRAFVASDDPRSSRVAVVNETLAKRVFPDGNAVGRTFRLRNDLITIVGIARDAKYASLDEATPAYVYQPLAQAWQASQTMLVRTAGQPAMVGPALQQAVRTLDAHLPQPRVSTLAAATAVALLPQRAAAIVTAVLGGLGLILAAVGLYGLMTFAAGRRTREVGIRIALGAPQASVLRLMVTDGLRLAAFGLVAGFVLAVPAARLLATWLFGVHPFDTATFVATTMVLLAVAAVASYLPARRAAALDPLKALRQ